MKKSDIAMVVLVAAISVVIAFVIAQQVFSGYETGKTKVKTIEKIEADVVQPDPNIFNKNAINPSVPVELLDSSKED